MQRNVIVFGGRSLVAPFALDQLRAEGASVTIVSRGLSVPPPFSRHSRSLFRHSREGGNPISDTPVPQTTWDPRLRGDDDSMGAESLSLDIEHPGAWLAPEGAEILSLMPIWVLAANLAPFAKAGRIVAISSTSRFGKAESHDPKERALAEKLAAAEETLEAWAAETGVPTTILRPTLIYDGKTDQNVTRIARMARKIGFFPVAWPAKGLRQPIHAEDVAKAATLALRTPESAGHALNIAGGEILPYAKMVRRIFRAVGRPPLLLPLPVGLLQNVYRLGAKTGLLKTNGLGFGAFQRMNEDLVFETEEGLRLLNYAPRPFSPDFENKV